MSITVREVLGYKWAQMKADPRIVILFVGEMMLAVCIALAIALYLDPDWNVVPFPYNMVSFLILLGVAILIHRRTRPYRVARRIGKRN
jgi:membrane protein implicated in regulation of membrane protease activity